MDCFWRISWSYDKIANERKGEQEDFGYLSDSNSPYPK